jgi:ribonuclease-3
LLFALFNWSTTKEDKVLQKFIEAKFGCRPKRLQLYRTALTHKSHSNTLEEVESNERLEFLGDTILDSVVAEYLFHKYPNQDEGSLTKLKSKLVSRKSLSTMGASIGIRNHILYQKGRAIQMSTLEGNALEALIGAIYLDRGYQVIKKAIEQHLFEKFVDLNKLLTEEIDFKSRLYIWSQKNKLNLEFIIKEENHNGKFWEYVSLVQINGKHYGQGTATSKKSAEQKAAKQTLILMGVIEIQ